MMRSESKKRAAFTLVELLAAMAVLAVLLLMCGNIFSSSTRAYNSGSTRAELNATVRATLDILMMEISQATVSTTMVFHLENSKFSTYNKEPATAATFITMVGYNENRDQVTALHYFIRETAPGSPTNRYELCRQESDWMNNLAKIKAIYQGQTWVNNVEGDAQATPEYKTLLANISSFKIMANGIDQDYVSDSANPPHLLPRFVDIYLGVLSEENVRKANLMYKDATAQAKFVRQHEKRYVQRVFPLLRNTVSAPTVP